MARYLDEYWPPFPAIDLSFRLPESQEERGQFTALVDTGADVTIVPLSILQEMNALAIDSAFIRSYWGERRSVRIYLVDISLEGVLLPTVEVIGEKTTGPILLGRDVLNKLVLLLDGPGKKIKIFSEYPSR